MARELDCLAAGLGWTHVLGIAAWQVSKSHGCLKPEDMARFFGSTGAMLKDKSDYPRGAMPKTDVNFHGQSEFAIRLWLRLVGCKGVFQRYAFVRRCYNWIIMGL